MLDFRIRTFLSVCRTHNYTHSARELNITQPAVSQHIAYLEKLYATKLFLYRNKQLVLTDEGALLRDTARQIAHDSELLEARLAESAGARRTITMGATLTAGEYMIAEPLACHLANDHDTQMHFISADTAELLDMVGEGSIDFALVEGFFDKSAFDWQVFKTEELVGIRSPETSIAASTLDGLLDEHLLIREKGSGTRAVLEHRLASHNLSTASFRRTSEITSINVIKRMVYHAYGIAFLYRAAVAEDLACGRLASIDLEESPITHDITFVWLKGSLFASEIRAFISHLQQQDIAPQRGKTPEGSREIRVPNR